MIPYLKYDMLVLSGLDNQIHWLQNLSSLKYMILLYKTISNNDAITHIYFLPQVHYLSIITTKAQNWLKGFFGTH